MVSIVLRFSTLAGDVMDNYVMRVSVIELRAMNTWMVHEKVAVEVRASDKTVVICTNCKNKVNVASFYKHDACSRLDMTWPQQLNFFIWQQPGGAKCTSFVQFLCHRTELSLLLCHPQPSVAEHPRLVHQSGTAHSEQESPICALPEGEGARRGVHLRPLPRHHPAGHPARCCQRRLVSTPKFCSRLNGMPVVNARLPVTLRGRFRAFYTQSPIVHSQETRKHLTRSPWGQTVHVGVECLRCLRQVEASSSWVSSFISKQNTFDLILFSYVANCYNNAWQNLLVDQLVYVND